jgi:site-specific DNA-methyltransferase (adenine-specific)
MHKKYVSFQTIVDELNISNATLHNWLKTKLLVSSKNSHISYDSYAYFKQYILGKSKLNKRANKQHYNDSQTPVLNILQDDNAHQQSSAYEQSLSVADRNKQGIYYTPEAVIEEMFEAIVCVDDNDTFLDPCCGTGNFLIKALEKGFKPENIYGFDIDQTALEIANKRFYQTTGKTTQHIKNLNLLEENHHQKYNFIFTNPPWGYKFNSEEKIYYAKKFNHGIKIDSAALFVILALNLLEKNGYLGVLLPDAFFNIGAFVSVRKKILEKRVLRLIDHEKPFTGLQTRAYSVIVQNNNKNASKTKCFFKNKKSYQRDQQSFFNNPNSIINFDTSTEEEKVISQLYSIPHQNLKGKAKWGLGIVTGDNAKHLKSTQEKGCKPIYRGCDIDKEKINAAQFYIVEDFSKFQQTAHKSLYLANKKIVYRFINSELIFALDNKQRYFLNSANFFILNKKNTPFTENNISITEEQLVFLMNTEIMSWLFKKIFNTHKVLRNDLECLPIFSDFFAQNDHPYYEENLWQYLNIEKHNGTFRIKK